MIDIDEEIASWDYKADSVPGIRPVLLSLLVLLVVVVTAVSAVVDSFAVVGVGTFAVVGALVSSVKTSLLSTSDLLSRHSLASR